MTWYRFTLTAGQLDNGELDRYREDFAAAFKAAGAPRTMALFQKAGADGGLDLLLTPDCAEHAAALLEAWGCTPYVRPGMAGLHLLVGFNEITYYIF
jgi:hypothetical protein